MSERASRSHTKSGPGRYHGQGLMTHVKNVRVVKEPQHRLAVAMYGGNWQGQKYLSYREHDAQRRARRQQH